MECGELAISFTHIVFVVLMKHPRIVPGFGGGGGSGSSEEGYVLDT